eukprot:TRINITY_DN7882_c0_g6_i1.p3 TRINITY_DN7882_c0_g6~~TRINITY_DN7882_c0_g6_i1.p3  ORF type:complete len:123 (-),score=18.64 TRINITY_DN7882_c0_g6_i1:1003-1371(-)
MLAESYRRGRLSKELNATFLTLIPKIPNLVDLKDYHPISLVGCVYKLLSKILVDRLKTVSSFIISPFQGAFVNKWQILDGILIANELIHCRKRSRKEGLIYKIDLERAYDHVPFKKKREEEE